MTNQRAAANQVDRARQSERYRQLVDSQTECAGMEKAANQGTRLPKLNSNICCVQIVHV
jgi:hypothetical protein